MYIHHTAATTTKKKKEKEKTSILQNFEGGDYIFDIL